LPRPDFIGARNDKLFKGQYPAEEDMSTIPLYLLALESILISRVGCYNLIASINSSVSARVRIPYGGARDTMDRTLEKVFQIFISFQ
jgi:hypothetical protein